MGRERSVEQIRVGTPAPLSRDDLPALSGGGRTTSSIQRMRASHHKVARLIAHGLTQKEVAALTGYTPLRISQLLGSPAMQELVAIYRDRAEDRENSELDEVTVLMAQNLLAAQRHIADTFDEADEKGELIPVRTALAVASDHADRLGYTKHMNVNVNHEFGAALERAISRSGKGPVIEHSPPVPMKTLPKPQPTSLHSASSVEGTGRPLILRRA